MNKVVAFSRKCIGCDELKSMEAFPVRNIQKSDWRCRRCTIKQNRKTPSGMRAARLGHLIRHHKKVAARQGVPATLKPGVLWKLWKDQGGLCALTGLPMLPIGGNRGTGFPDPRSSSLDRIVGGLGYVPGNVRWVCFAVNMFKGTMTDAEVLSFAKAIVSHQEKE